jgi:hypothetical protein
MSVLLLVPLATFSLFSFIKPDTGYWELLSVIVGLPLAYVSIRMLFLSEHSRRMGLLPPWVLYTTGVLCTVSFLLVPNHPWGASGVGILLVHAARQRQITRRKMRGESLET